MPRTGLKAFVYSFSVSLFAIIAANRAFWHEETAQNEPLNISSKNIVLFLKNNSAAKFPVKKIALNTLPEISKKASVTPQPEPEIIMANTLESIDFPLEIITNAPADTPQTGKEAKAIILADVLYSPEKPAETPKIDAQPIYTPEKETLPNLEVPIPQQPVIYTAEAAETALPAPPEIQPTSAEEEALKLARTQTAATIPLQKSNNITPGDSKVKIGNPQDLNHVALNSQNIPIQSMEKNAEKTVAKSETDVEKVWAPMQDDPWVIAKSGGGAKNRLALKEFDKNSASEISKTLNPGEQRQGVQIASETVKNLIIPIPGEIMKENDLTPKLAYPSTSEDAAKEKIIDARIKKQEQKEEAKEEKKGLLSPIEEDIALDVVPPVTDASSLTLPQTPINQTAVKNEPIKKEEKGGIMNALNSIFATSPKTAAEAKEKAIAKAQAKRSFKKRLAKTRPVSIMPTEIRLSFQPNRAEISGQTLRWVQAFASKAAETPNMSLEIRIDGTSSMNLQQKRLNLLHNILTNKGVEYSKINTVFTTREPNSFILRTINPESNNSGGTERKANNINRGQYIQW